MKLIDGPKLDMTAEVKSIVENATTRANTLRRMARQQDGMPSRFRLELVSCAVTIEVLVAQLEKATKPQCDIEIVT